MPKATFYNLKEEKQERILRSAIAEFNAHGFAGANVAAIAKNAEVAKGSMYQYFKDKTELFVHCVAWATGILMEKAGQQAAFENTDIFDYFSKDIAMRIKLVHEERELTLFTQDVFLGKFRAMPEAATAEMTHVADEYVLGHIRAGRAKGSIRSDIDEGLLKLFLVGATMRIKEHVLKEAEESILDLTGDKATVEKFGSILEDMIDLLKNGMGSKEA
ncbi:MAG: TetR/AcrR family transcriptional regulator [Clostridiales bacterium]|nr:TetR/AcrR family transcriptional regulator [Clostridiales bacterium]